MFGKVYNEFLDITGSSFTVLILGKAIKKRYEDKSCYQNKPQNSSITEESERNLSYVSPCLVFKGRIT